jgi:hypothetical protein
VRQVTISAFLLRLSLTSIQKLQGTNTVREVTNLHMPAGPFFYTEVEKHMSVEYWPNAIDINPYVCMYVRMFN